MAVLHLGYRGFVQSPRFTQSGTKHFSVVVLHNLGKQSVLLLHPVQILLWQNSSTPGQLGVVKH